MDCELDTLITRRKGRRKQKIRVSFLRPCHARLTFFSFSPILPFLPSFFSLSPSFLFLSVFIFFISVSLYVSLSISVSVLASLFSVPCFLPIPS